jgi:hypothetical protein
VEARRGYRQSCKECKAAFYRFLADAFGSGAVVQRYRFRLPSTLQGYDQYPYFSMLAAIESELKAYRGFIRFVSQRNLHPVDLFVRSVGLIVEFDEAQHFTRPQAMALARYPATLIVGFSRER